MTARALRGGDGRRLRLYHEQHDRALSVLGEGGALVLRHELMPQITEHRG